MEYLGWLLVGLLTALDKENVDDQLLTSAGEIIQALIAGGPAEDIDCYEDGATTLELYVKHVERKAATLDDLLTVTAIRDFLADEEADWDSRRQRGWIVGESQSFCDGVP